MGCFSSKESTPTTTPIGRERLRKPWRSIQQMTSRSAEMRLVMALQDLKKQMDEEQSIHGAFSFTKIILKLGNIERVLKCVKAVFRSVDHGNKGHVTKEELMEGLRKAKVDLGEEWEDTNIEQCLEHLGEGGGDHDRFGIREFVVMLAVGRVCRPKKRRSSIFVPLSRGISGGDGGEDSLRRMEKERPRAMMTIDENEAQRPSVTSTVLAPAGNEAAQSIAKVEAGQGVLGSASGSSAAVAATAAAAAAAEVKDEYREEQMLPAPKSAEEAEDSELLRASAGPGGLPRGRSWRNLMWARIPPLRSIDLSERPMRRLSRSRSNSSLQAKGSAGLGGEGDVSASVKYVLDLFIAAYFEFDTKAKGYITRSTIEKKLRQAVRESGSISLLDQKRWSELAWKDDRLSFQEFIFAFAQWLGLPEDDDDDDDDETSNFAQTKHSAARRTVDGSTISDRAAAAASGSTADASAKSLTGGADAVVGLPKGGVSLEGSRSDPSLGASEDKLKREDGGEVGGAFAVDAEETRASESDTLLRPPEARGIMMEA